MKHRQQLSQCNTSFVYKSSERNFIKLEYLPNTFEMMYFFEWSTDIHHRSIVLRGFFIILPSVILYQHYSDFSKSREHTKCMSAQPCSAEGVPKIKQLLSIIFCAIYGAVCFALIHFFSGRVRLCIYLIIIIKSEWWAINYFYGKVMK